MSATVGAMAPPDGVTANFDGHLTTLQREFYIVWILTFFAATVALVARVYTRGWIVRAFGLDDYAVVAAYLVSVGFFASCFMKYGFARHLWDVPATRIPGYLKVLVPVVITYVWAPMLTKLSILLLYRRLNDQRYFIVCVYSLGFIIIGYTLAVTIVISTGCSPIDTNKSSCVAKLGLWQAILNIVSDILMICLPMPMLYHLKLPISQKLAIGGIFAGGSFVILASIVRIRYIEALSGQPDITWYEGTTCIWSVLEINFGVICNCAVILKPFFRRHFPSLVGSGYERGSWNQKSRGSLFALFKRERHQSMRLDSISNHQNDSATPRQQKAFDGRLGGSGIEVTTTYDIENHEINAAKS